MVVRAGKLPWSQLLRAAVRRRDFISVRGGAAAIPIAVHAQQGERVRSIGVLLPAAAGDPVFEARLAAFHRELAVLGWSIGGNVRIDTRWATTNPSEIRRHAAELVALAPDAILSTGDSTVPPLLQATRTVPIVFPRQRSGRRRLRREPGSTRRQRHRVHASRIQHRREIAGAAQRDRAKRDAGGGPSGFR